MKTSHMHRDYYKVQKAIDSCLNEDQAMVAHYMAFNFNRIYENFGLYTALYLQCQKKLKGFKVKPPASE